MRYNLECEQDRSLQSYKFDLVSLWFVTKNRSTSEKIVILFRRALLSARSRSRSRKLAVVKRPDFIRS